MAVDPPTGSRLPVASSKAPAAASEPKPRGANRSTKVAGKLQVLPEQPDVPTQSQILPEPSKPKPPRAAEPPVIPEPTSGSTAESDEDADDEEEELEEQDAEVYNQIAQIPEGTARRDALRLTKKKAKSLPRVTAYATASSYRMSDLMKFFQARKNAYHTNPRFIEDVLYTAYSYNSATQDSKSNVRPSPSHSEDPSQPKVGDLLNAPDIQIQDVGSGTEVVQKSKEKKRRKFDAGGGQYAEIFAFEYGTVVIWGMTEAEEKRFLSSIKRFEVERLPPEDIEMEDLNYYYANYSRIFNDVITLRRGSGFMTKLALSHALAQSVKISMFEMLISSNIEHTKDVPELISETGKVGMPHKEIMQQIGELFLLRMNINLVGSVLDVPEVFWSYPDLQPLYEAARSYLEIPQRVNLLNTRVEVLQDMLQLLKESVTSKHSERLEQIVIALIAVEIVLGIITIIVDLFA
ncbi:RMD1 [Sanghuangporus sanghuang]